MIYIKYTNRYDPSFWYIFAHEKGSKVETMILAYTGSTYPYQGELNLSRDNEYYKVKYLTEKEINLLKLELL